MSDNGHLPIHVLFICAGNTCRSPMAEALLRHHLAEAGLSERVTVGSAGVRADVGAAVTPAALAVLAERGIVHEGSAQQLDCADWARARFLLAMDLRSLRAARRLCSPDDGPRAKAHLLLDFARGVNETEVFDPYGTTRYEEACVLIENGVTGFLAHIRKVYGV